MAFKSTVAESVALHSMAQEYDRPAEPMRFKIEGLKEVEPGVYEIMMKPINLDYEAIEKQLMAGGIDRRTAVDYIESFAEMVQQKEVARMLTRNMERVY